MGRGSAALGDFEADFSADMGEQDREVESRNETRSDLGGRGGGPAAKERATSSAGGATRLFPADYPVDEAYYPLLNAIAQAHPETFVSFKPRSPRLGSMLLKSLHDVVSPWAQLRFGEFTLAMEAAMQGLAQDMVAFGIDLSWLSDTGSALRAASDRAALQLEIRNLSAQLESGRQHLANLEAQLAQAQQQDAELAAAALNFANPDPAGLVFGELTS